METQTIHLPAQTFTIRDKYGRPTPHTAPAQDILVAPTLQKIHKWMFDDFGPLVLSWVDGELCPFADRVSTRNIRCTEGRRKHCHGLLISSRFTAHLPQVSQRRYNGRVMCYPWSHRLIDSYWDLANNWLLQLPDNPKLVAHLMLREIYRTSLWQDWRFELRRRLDGKRRLDWLKPLSSNHSHF